MVIYSEPTAKQVTSQSRYDTIREFILPRPLTLDQDLTAFVRCFQFELWIGPRSMH